MLRRPAVLLGGLVSVVLVVVAGRYGPHRDELYFVAAGERLALGYPDQGPLTPFLARVMSEISDSLTVLRLPAALMAGAVVLLTGLLARELGGSRRAEALAAACASIGVVFLFVGHMLSTSTFDLLSWTLVTYLVVRALRREEDRLWLVAGAVLGLGLLNKPLPAFLAFGLLAGVAVAGPRRLLRSPWVWAGAVLALLMWAPWLVWQADRGWPQLEVSGDIAEGGSVSSEPRWALLPFQFLLVSPLLAPVWIAGLVWLYRAREWRFLFWTWVALVVVFIATAGKPYYLAGMLPLLLAAGAEPVLRWASTRSRRAALVVALGLSAVVGPLIALPLLPAGSLDPVLAANEDVGETVGWESFVRQVEAVPGAVVFTSNYGEAGALDRYGARRAYSGHNGYADWGIPPGSRGPVVVVGVSDPAAHFSGCRLALRVRMPVDNEEDGAPVWRCSAPRRPWRELWPSLRHLG